MEVCVFCAECNLSRPRLCKSEGSCPAVLEQFTWLGHSPSLDLLVLTNVCGCSPPPPASHQPQLQCLVGVIPQLCSRTYECISRKCYANQLQKGGKHRKMKLMLSLKQRNPFHMCFFFFFFGEQEAIISSTCAVTDWYHIFLANTEQLICCRSQDSSQSDLKRHGLPGQKTRHAPLTLALTNSVTNSMSQ